MKLEMGRRITHRGSRAKWAGRSRPAGTTSPFALVFPAWLFPVEGHNSGVRAGARWLRNRTERTEWTNPGADGPLSAAPQLAAAGFAALAETIKMTIRSRRTEGEGSPGALGVCTR
jgi:hypothetical protein